MESKQAVMDSAQNRVAATVAKRRFWSMWKSVRAITAPRAAHHHASFSRGTCVFHQSPSQPCSALLVEWNTMYDNLLTNKHVTDYAGGRCTKKGGHSCHPCHSGAIVGIDENQGQRGNNMVEQSSEVVAPQPPATQEAVTTSPPRARWTLRVGIGFFIL